MESLRPHMLKLDYSLAHRDECWPVIRENFYAHFGQAKPNRVHELLAAWEAWGLLKVLITQQIDSVQLS
jgi:NAD-dependent deacetylase